MYVCVCGESKTYHPPQGWAKQTLVCRLASTKGQLTLVLLPPNPQLTALFCLNTHAHTPLCQVTTKTNETI